MSDPNSDLCYLTATECLAGFKANKLKPSELVQALIARAQRHNPKINALTDCYFEHALQDSKIADRKYADGLATRPLEGLPILVKDAQRVMGQRTTFGSLLHMEAEPDIESDPMIERLLNAGCIVLALSLIHI